MPERHLRQGVEFPLIADEPGASVGVNHIKRRQPLVILGAIVKRVVAGGILSTFVPVVTQFGANRKVARWLVVQTHRSAQKLPSNPPAEAGLLLIPKSG